MTVVDRQWIVENLAIVAVALAEDGTPETDALAQLSDELLRFGMTDKSIFRDAAAHVSLLPQPIDESPDEIERASYIRELLDVPSAESQLAATLKGREWLEKLADDR